MDTETLKKRVGEIGFWYHKIQLPGGVETPGMNPISAHSYKVPQDLSGMRVLDVGTWDGYWTFEALKRGAKQVVAIDDFSDFLGQLKAEQRHAWQSFDLCREMYGYSEEQCQRTEMSVYDVSPERLGRFDVVFFFGTLYHLRHPLLALDKLGTVCDKHIIVESSICDDWSPYRGGNGHGYPGKQMVMEFYPTVELAGNATNWWAPTLQCMHAMVFAAGFTRLESWKLVERPKTLGQCRGFVHGRK